eukprot:scaffold18747_cov100-Skeletonema_dohrnii-CCMP3373.AAC.2
MVLRLRWAMLCQLLLWQLLLWQRWALAYLLMQTASERDSSLAADSAEKCLRTLHACRNERSTRRDTHLFWAENIFSEKIRLDSSNVSGRFPKQFLLEKTAVPLLEKMAVPLSETLLPSPFSGRDKSNACSSHFSLFQPKRQHASGSPLQLHKQLTATTMKLSTAAAIMTISASVLSLPATVTASSSKTSKQAKGVSYSMSIHSKASKKAKGGSYSMSVDTETNSCRRKRRFNCAPFKDGLKDCDELTNSCLKGRFRYDCTAGPNKPGKEVCGRMCNPGCPQFPPPPGGSNPCTYAPNLECYPSNNGWPQCCVDDPTKCTKNEPCETEMV